MGRVDVRPSPRLADGRFMACLPLRAIGADDWHHRRTPNADARPGRRRADHRHLARISRERRDWVPHRYSPRAVAIPGSDRNGDLGAADRLASGESESETGPATGGDRAAIPRDL